MTRTIFLDMDGVLADFEGSVTAAGIPGPHDYIQHPRDTWGPEELARDARVKELMADPLFWRYLRPMDGAKELLAVGHGLAGRSTYVLTALPSSDPYRAAMVRYEKQRWLVRNLDFPVHRVITCLRSEKAQHAHPHHILVDDLVTNCREWAAAGGSDIIHTNASTSISRLLEICL